SVTQPGPATRCAKIWCRSSPRARKRFARGSKQAPGLRVVQRRRSKHRLYTCVRRGLFLLEQFQRLGECQVRGHPLEAGESLRRIDGEILEQEDLSGEPHTHA